MAFNSNLICSYNGRAFPKEILLDLHPNHILPALDRSTGGRHWILQLKLHSVSLVETPVAFWQTVEVHILQAPGLVFEQVSIFKLYRRWCRFPILSLHRDLNRYPLFKWHSGLNRSWVGILESVVTGSSAFCCGPWLAKLDVS